MTRVTFLILFSANEVIERTEQTTEINAAFLAAATELEMFYVLGVLLFLLYIKTFAKYVKEAPRN